MAGLLQPLDQKFPIVGDDGKPTLYFIKWAQQRQIDIDSGITLSDLIDYLTAHKLIEGIGIQLSNSGDINQGVTISADVQEILDTLSATRGTIIYRGLLGWTVLLPGTSGFFLQTSGPGADPVWAAGGGGGGTDPGLVAHRYWKIHFMGSRNFAVAVQDIEMRATPAGANQCSGGTASASAVDGGAAANAFDGSAATYWATLVGGAAAQYYQPAWIGYDFGTTKIVQQITITSRTGAGDQTPLFGRLMWSDDNITFYTAFEWDHSTVYGAGATRTLTHPKILYP